MDPNANTPAQSFDLPQPGRPEAVPGVNPNTPVPETNQQTEQHNMELPSAVAPALVPQVPPVPPVVPAGQQQPLATVPAAPAPIVLQDDDVLTAEDDDLIEKAWVQKAKDIVERTKNDPYNQNKEINKVKASYIKKRYNMDIKMIDEQGQ